MSIAEMIRKSFPVQIKQGGERTFAVTISTGTVDRDGDTIDPKGWDLRAYRANPIVLWQHDHSLPPIARAADVRVQGQKLVAVMEFPPPGVSPLADEIHGLMKAGFLHSTSVGFLPLRSTPNGTGQDIHEAELLEFSVVNVPSQVEARVRRCAGEACDELALKSWLGRSCECDDAVVLEIAPSPYRHPAKDAGRRAHAALPKRWDEPVLMIEDVYDIDERVVAAGTLAACVAWIASTAAEEATKAIRYAQGRVS